MKKTTLAILSIAFLAVLGIGTYVLLAPPANDVKPDSSPFSGTITIDHDNVVIDLELKTESANFKYEAYYLVEHPNYLGIVFRYCDQVNRYNADDDSPTNKIPIKQVISGIPSGWAEGKKVRLMCFNEDKQQVFEGLKDYFKLRLNRFRDSDTLQDYDTFNADWNTNHPNNCVNYDKHICNPNYDKKPRFTKDDGVLSLRKI